VYLCWKYPGLILPTPLCLCRWRRPGLKKEGGCMRLYLKHEVPPPSLYREKNLKGLLKKRPLFPILHNLKPQIPDLKSQIPDLKPQVPDPRTADLGVCFEATARTSPRLRRRWSARSWCTFASWMQVGVSSPSSCLTMRNLRSDRLDRCTRTGSIPAMVGHNRMPFQVRFW